MASHMFLESKFKPCCTFTLQHITTSYCCHQNRNLWYFDTRRKTIQWLRVIVLYPRLPALRGTWLNYSHACQTPQGKRTNCIKCCHIVSHGSEVRTYPQRMLDPKRNSENCQQNIGNIGQDPKQHVQCKQVPSSSSTSSPPSSCRSKRAILGDSNTVARIEASHLATIFRTPFSTKELFLAHRKSLCVLVYVCWLCLFVIFYQKSTKSSCKQQSSNLTSTIFCFWRSWGFGGVRINQGSANKQMRTMGSSLAAWFLSLLHVLLTTFN